MHPQPRVRLGSEICTRVFTAEAPEPSGIPHAMVLTVSFALSPVIGLSCHRRPRDAKHHREFDAGIEASGPHDFAVRVSAVRYRHLRVHRIPPRVRDDREPPLRWDETARNTPVIWVGCEEQIFLSMGLDRGIKKPGRAGIRVLKLPNNFFGGRLGVLLGGGIVGRYETGRGLAPDETAGLPIRGYGSSPMSRPAFVSHDRKLGYLGHSASDTRPRANGAAMSTAVSGRLLAGLDNRPSMFRPPRSCRGRPVAIPRRSRGASMTPFAKLFSTRTLLQIVLVLAATFALKALSLHYDFSWATALTAG
jgi:hypothetical protein